MEKFKRILALTGVIFLVSLYIITFIAAIFTTPYSDSLFKASIFCTVLIPIILYAYILIYKLVKKKKSED